MTQAYFLFFSTNHAIWAEQVLVAAGVNARVVPVPRHLSSDCGYCVRIDAAESEVAQTRLREAKIDLDRIAVDQGIR